MSKVAKIVAKVASVVAIVAAVAAVVTGNPALAALFLKISAIAGAVGAVAGTIAQVTAKKPPARGSPNLITIGANQPMPIVLGETYIGGNKVHEVGYGGKIGNVENPYKFEAIIQSGCGPVDSFTGLYADFNAVPLSGTAATGYFAGFLYADRQLGARPESDALVPNWSGTPDWTSAHKLSGYAAIGLSLKFDKDGKIFASGEPQWGSTVRGVKHYDPRLDSTYPGGSGTQRINDRSTWTYSANPGIVGLTYCYGWFDSGKKQGGIGMPIEGIDLARWVEFANVCDANAWTLGGVVYEPGSRWDNLKDICAAGGGEPYFDRHLLGVNYSAPRVSLDTITRDDIADEGLTVASGRTWRERLNTIVPKFRSGAHKWEYVPAADVAISEYITDDGEEKREEITWNLVQGRDQVAQLAAYELVNRREIGQIEVHCKPRLMRYTVGDMLSFDLPGTVVDNLDAIIIRPPEIDPESGRVKLTMMGETTAKHDFALGRTSTAPPVPSLVGTDVLDNTKATNNPSGDGVDGLSNATVFAFKRSATPPINPSATATYTFATGALTGLNNGWTQAVPASDGNPLYVIAATASSNTATDTIAAVEWSTAVIQAQDGGNGPNGLSTASVYLYQRNDTGIAPAVPTDTLTYTFATGVLSGGSFAGWSRSVPAASGGKYVFITTATALSASATDTIGTSEWATVQILAQDGTFSHIAYSTAPDGSAGFSTTDGAGKTYIGTYTDTTEADSTNPAVYTWSLIKGADGIDPLDLAAVPNFVPVVTNAIGTVKSGQLPRTVTFNTKEGNSDVTGSTTFTLGTLDQCAVTNSGGGVFTLDSVSADQGGFEVTATKGSKSTKRKVTFAKAKEGAAAQRSAINSLGTPTTSYGAAAGVISLNLFPSTTITMSMYAGYDATGTGSARIDARLMYRNITDGGAWTQAGSTLVGSNASNTGGSEPVLTPGAVGGSATVTAPTSTKIFEFRVEWIRAGTTIFTYGTGLQVEIT